MSSVYTYPYDYLINESQSLIARLKQVKPFAMTMPMVRGAAVSDKALKEVTALLEKGKQDIFNSISEFIQKINIAKQKNVKAQELQSEYTIQKLRYNSILDQLDIFSDVFTQRAEHDVGIWLSGLDILASDGLSTCKKYFDAPSLMVFLERGHGAAIRRARTRLPGGDLNPVAVIQIPRERMVGSGIASSLIHEVGHQAAESLELTKALRNELLRKSTNSNTRNQNAWKHYERWISEIIADCWAMGHLGITATQGLMGVVTLPKYFQFRLDLDDPHPAPYVRVKLSCAFGKALFPHSQWERIWKLWELFYPVDELKNDKKKLLTQLDEEEDNFVQLVLQLKPKILNGKMIKELFPVNQRQPLVLQQLYEQWKSKPGLMHRASPTLVFAVLGQAKFDLLIDAREENTLLTQQLRIWAYNKN